MSDPRRPATRTLLRTRSLLLFLELAGCDVTIFITLRALLEWGSCVFSHNKTAHGAPRTVVYGCYQGVLYFQNVMRFKSRPTSGITLMPMISWVHYTTSCNTQSGAPEDGQNNFPKHVELTGIINNPLLLHLVGCLYYLYQ